MTTNQYKNIKPLVIGIGVAGKRHLEAQLSLGLKTGIYSTNPKTKQLLGKNKNVIVFDSLQDGLDWSNLVHVCTPDDKHAEFVAMAAKMKKNVLCEKAFTTNLEDALYLQKLAHKYGVILIVGQNYRLTPTFADTKKRILEKQLGIVTRIKTTYLHDREDYQKRYPNQKFLFAGGAHAVDLACWIAGEKVTDIKVNSEGKLSYKITLRFASGLEGNIMLDASLPRLKSGTDLKVFGEKGNLASHNKSDKLFLYHTEKNKPELTLLPNTTTYTIPLEIKIIDEYLSGITSSLQPLPSVDEAISTIKILDAVEKNFS